MAWDWRHVFTGSTERERRTDTELPIVITTPRVETISRAAVPSVRSESNRGLRTPHRCHYNGQQGRNSEQFHRELLKNVLS